MNSFRRSGVPLATTNTPEACPACRSPLVTTTEKHPDINTYWRCQRCGEVWNVGRRDHGPRPVGWR